MAVGHSAKPDIRVSVSVRCLRVALTTFAHRCRRTSAITASEWVLDPFLSFKPAQPEWPPLNVLRSSATPPSTGRSRNALEYSPNQADNGQTSDLVWVVPSSSAWGASRALARLLESIARATDAADATSRTDIAITRDRSKRHLRKTFGRVVVRSDDGEIPASLEIMLVPRRMVAVVVNAPIGVGRGFPVPLGFLSFDQEVLRRTHEYLEDKLCPRSLEAGEEVDWSGLLDWTQPLSCGDSNGVEELGPRSPT